MRDLAVIGKGGIQVDPVTSITDKAADLMKEIGIIAQFIGRLEFNHSSLIRRATSDGFDNFKRRPTTLILVKIKM